MNIYIILVALVVGLFGMTIGFFMSDKRNGSLSLQEIKIGTILFMIVNVFMIFFNESQQFIWLQLLLQWLILSGGLLLGEYIHTRFVGRVTGKSVKRRDVEKTILNFKKQLHYQVSNVCVANVQDIKKLDDEFKPLLREISRLKKLAQSIKKPHLVAQIKEIEETSLLLHRLCTKYDMDEDAINRKIEYLADDLSILTFEIIKETEKETESALRTRSIGPIVHALKQQQSMQQQNIK